jgi:hypothetical protein
MDEIERESKRVIAELQMTFTALAYASAGPRCASRLFCYCPVIISCSCWSLCVLEIRSVPIERLLLGVSLLVGSTATNLSEVTHGPLRLV